MKFRILIYILIFTTFTGYTQKLILFSKAKLGGTYMTFIHKVDSTLLLKSAYNQPKDSIDTWLKKASGIIITGGRDIYPAIYGKANEIEKCGKFDRYRDTLELKMINYAKNNQVPLLGICRGHQMLNVAMGGSLYTDIPTDIKNNVTHRNSSNPPTHKIKFEKNSLLHKITSVKKCKVNSYHHQCVDKLGENLSVLTQTSDGVIESIYYNKKEWVALGVQWHPEKHDFGLPCAGKIGEWFISQTEKER
jgi:putative glutamine amidotransferase